MLPRELERVRKRFPQRIVIENPPDSPFTHALHGEPVLISSRSVDSLTVSSTGRQQKLINTEAFYVK